MRASAWEIEHEHDRDELRDESMRVDTPERHDPNRTVLAVSFFCDGCGKPAPDIGADVLTTDHRVEAISVHVEWPDCPTCTGGRYG